jgi:hypothetical protein
MESRNFWSIEEFLCCGVKLRSTLSFTVFCIKSTIKSQQSLIERVRINSRSGTQNQLMVALLSKINGEAWRNGQ